MSDTPETPKLSWWRRLSGGLKRTSSALGTAVADLVTKRKLDRAMLEDIEDVLLRADLGTEVAARISAAVGHGRYDKAISADEVKTVVATEVEKVLSAVAKPLVIDTSTSRSSSSWSASTVPARPPPSASWHPPSPPKAAR
jgi:fused signal recognition particle receptor